MLKTNYRVLDPNLIEYIADLSEKEQGEWLILSPHPQFKGRWVVDSLRPGFFFDFEDLIGRFRTISPAKLDQFFAYAQELEYEVVFSESPYEILDNYEHLNEPPPFHINSNLPETINGLLPFQLQGFNYLKNPELKGGLALWSTGSGKSLVSAALIKWHLLQQEFDVCLIVVKSNNKKDTQTKLKYHSGLDSIIIDGTPDKRSKIYTEIEDQLELKQPVIAVTNYEKFREDETHFKNLLEDRRVLIFFDEMPTRLRNRSTQLYKSIRDSLYKSGKQISWESKRPSWLRTYQLTATPIENNPADQLNCIRLQDPEVFPSIQWWEKRFVLSRNFFSREPETFRDLDEMGLMLEFMTHQVDKEDPDISQMFPKVVESAKLIDWHPQHQKVYQKLQMMAAEASVEAIENPDQAKIHPFAMIGILQMLCDAPSMVQRSAENRDEFDKAMEELVDIDTSYTSSGSGVAQILRDTIGTKELINDHHTKLETLRELLTEQHSDEKVLVFSTFADYIFPILAKQFEEWGVTYTIFRGTTKQRQEAKDQFRNDASIQVFLSSDAGSDSIDLPEASVVVHYNLPWKWSTLIQRQNRAHRVNSEHSQVRFYTLMMADSIESRKEEIINKKLGYHKGIFKGEISEEAVSSRMTKEDLHYILTGEVLS